MNTDLYFGDDSCAVYAVGTHDSDYGLKAGYWYWTVKREPGSLVNGDVTVDTVLRDGEPVARIIGDSDRVTVHCLVSPNDNCRRPEAGKDNHIDALAWVLEEFVYGVHPWHKLAEEMFEVAGEAAEGEVEILRRENARLRRMLARQGVAA